MTRDARPQHDARTGAWRAWVEPWVHSWGGFHPASMPAYARANYRRELLAAFFLPFLLAVVDSAIVGVVVKNAYDGAVAPKTLNFVVALLTASTAFANIVSFAWVRLSHGVDKVRFINALQVAMIVLVALIALAPRTAPGLWLVVAAVLAARFCWAGFITIRSTIWRQNYSRAVRARVTGKLATVQVLTLAALGVGLGMAMNADPRAFRFLLPFGCALSLVGVWAWARMRIRGHRALLAAERASAGDADAPSLNPVAMARLLAGDRLFAGYMTCMMLLGLGNLMLTPLLVIAVKEEFGMEYLGGIAVTNSVPLAMMPLSIPLWARLLDRVHVVVFRTVHSWVFVAASALFLLSVVTHTVWLLYAASVVQGLAFGGGVLAWNLGHLDFAPPHRVSQYMGVHVTLTGVRGLLAPFIAVGIYESARAIDPAWGAAAFAACTTCCIAGAVGFKLLARAMGDGRGRREEPVETAPPARVTE
ncbi:MAG: MFS transporter [Phycisphaeraceae bacterium]|nr:MFS transporter [Phycisphaeraceae bacterium]